MKEFNEQETDVLESYFFLMLNDDRISKKKQEAIAEFEQELKKVK